MNDLGNNMLSQSIVALATAAKHLDTCATAGAPSIEHRYQLRAINQFVATARDQLAQLQSEAQ